MSRTLASTDTKGGRVGAWVGRKVSDSNDSHGRVDAQLSLAGSFFLSIATEGGTILFPFASKNVAA